jgi:hypothetical protein
MPRPTDPGQLDAGPKRSGSSSLAKSKMFALPARFQYQ